jgi:toxin FitB
MITASIKRFIFFKIDNKQSVVNFSIQAQVFWRWLEDQVLPSFGNRILPVDISVARKSARSHIPNPKPMRDSLIAATAAAHLMIVVTRNV